MTPQITRRQFMVGASVLGGTLLAGCSLPFSQQSQPARMYRLGWLASSEPGSANGQAFLQMMGELGYAEGQNLAIEWRLTEGRTESLPQFAAELARLPLDVIITATPPVTAVAKDATSTIPIVFIGGSDPVEQGFVVSLARPGGTLTGLTSGPISVQSEKQLELLKETVPSASHIAILSQQGITHTLWPGLHYAAGVLGVELMPLEVQHLGDLVGAFEAAVRQRADALLVLPEPLFAARRAPQLPELAAAYRLPSMYWQRDAVEAGGLMSYGTNLPALWRRAAYYVDRILKGTKPADLPVEQPMTFD